MNVARIARKRKARKNNKFGVISVEYGNSLILYT